MRKRLFIALIILWSIISVFNVFFNIVKFVVEAKHLIPLSGEQKKVEVYGDVYNFLKFIEEKTDNNSSVLIYSNDDKAYFLGIYVLYPRIVSSSGNFENIKMLLKAKKYDYIASDNAYINFDMYKLFSSRSSYLIFKKI